MSGTIGRWAGVRWQSVITLSTKRLMDAAFAGQADKKAL